MAVNSSMVGAFEEDGDVALSMMEFVLMNWRMLILSCRAQGSAPTAAVTALPAPSPAKPAAPMIDFGSLFDRLKAKHLQGGTKGRPKTEDGSSAPGAVEAAAEAAPTEEGTSEAMATDGPAMAEAVAAIPTSPFASAFLPTSPLRAGTGGMALAGGDGDDDDDDLEIVDDGRTPGKAQVGKGHT